MPDPIVPPVAPAAVSEPAKPAPAVTPEAPPVTEPKKSSLLSNILNLVSPEEAKVEPVKEPVKEPVAPAKEEPKAVEAPVAPEPKKVSVKKKEAPQLPLPDFKSAVTAAVREAMPAAPAPAAPAAPAAPDDSGLTPEEKEELDLATYAETKDPSKKGLAGQYRAFFKAQKDFLEQRTAAEGDDYDPTSDPKYKAFLAKHEPKFSATERKALFREKTVEDAEQRALKKAEEKFQPEIEKVNRRVRQIEETPRIAERVNRFLFEATESMPDDLLKFYKENGSDLGKVKEAYPEEADAVISTLQGSSALAHEFLSIRSKVKDFNPKDGMHIFLDNFVTKQADNFIANGGKYLERDGKTFIHPKLFTPQMANSRWTFDDEDVLAGLKLSASREAKGRVEGIRTRQAASTAAAEKRKAAQNSTVPPVTQPVVPEVKSPVTPPAPSSGAAAPAPGKSNSVLSNILNLS